MRCAAVPPGERQALPEGETAASPKCAVDRARRSGRARPGRRGKLSEYDAQLREKRSCAAPTGSWSSSSALLRPRDAHAGDHGRGVAAAARAAAGQRALSDGVRPSRPAGRQLVRHGHIRVTPQVSVPRYRLRPGDVISVKTRVTACQSSRRLSRGGDASQGGPTWKFGSCQAVGTSCTCRPGPTSRRREEQLIRRVYSK